MPPPSCRRGRLLRRRPGAAGFGRRLLPGSDFFRRDFFFDFGGDFDAAFFAAGSPLRRWRWWRRRARAFAAVFEAVVAGGALEFFERRAAASACGFARAPALSSRSAASLTSPSAVREFVGGGDEFGVAGAFVRRAEVLEAVRPCRCRGRRPGRPERRASASHAPTVPTAALTSAQIASPWEISSALLSAVGAVRSSAPWSRSSRRRRRRSRRAPARASGRRTATGGIRRSHRRRS